MGINILFWEGMGINILLWEGIGMFLFTSMGMVWEWEWEYDRGNGRNRIKKVIPAHLLSAALNLAITRCFHMARNESVRSLLYFVGRMPMNMMLDERKVK